MFFIGTSKNLGAHTLVEKSEDLLKHIRFIVQCICLVPEPGLQLPPCLNEAERDDRHTRLIAATQAVCVQFDLVLLDARCAAAEMARFCRRKGCGTDEDYEPDLDQVFTQAALQACYTAQPRSARDPIAAHVLHTT